MKKILLILLLSVILSTGIFSLDSFTIEDPQLLKLFEAQQLNSQAWAANEVFLETGNLNYDISRSMLFPQVDADLTGAVANSFLTRTPAEPVDIDIKNTYSITGTPKLSISQLLPTAGVLTGSISDSFSGSGIKGPNSESISVQEIEFSNKLDLSIGFSQPLFFGGAYKASLTQINESRDINYVSYMDNRNALLYAAVSDYYTLIRAAYQKDLVEKRLETNVHYENRMIREHQLGMWTTGQLNTATAVRLQAEADLLKAEQALKSSVKMIETLYGLKIDPEEFNSEISVFSFDIEAIETFPVQLLKGNPEILKSLKNILIEDSEIVIKKKSAAPALTGGGNYSISNSLEDETFSDKLSFSLGISLPVADGKYSSNTIELKKKELEQLKNNQADQQKKIISQLQSLTDNIKLTNKLAEIYILQEQSAVFEVEKGIKELELGGITQKELLELQIDLENTRLSIVLNKIDFNLTVLQIYRLLGTDLTLLTGTREGA